MLDGPRDPYHHALSAGSRTVGGTRDDCHRQIVLVDEPSVVSTCQPVDGVVCFLVVDVAYQDEREMVSKYQPTYAGRSLISQEEFTKHNRITNKLECIDEREINPKSFINIPTLM